VGNRSQAAATVAFRWCESRATFAPAKGDCLRHIRVRPAKQLLSLFQKGQSHFRRDHAKRGGAKLGQSPLIHSPVLSEPQRVNGCSCCRWPAVCGERCSSEGAYCRIRKRPPSEVIAATRFFGVRRLASIRKAVSVSSFSVCDDGHFRNFLPSNGGRVAGVGCQWSVVATEHPNVNREGSWLFKDFGSSEDGGAGGDRRTICGDSLA